MNTQVEKHTPAKDTTIDGTKESAALKAAYKVLKYKLDKNSTMKTYRYQAVMRCYYCDAIIVNHNVTACTRCGKLI